MCQAAAHLIPITIRGKKYGPTVLSSDYGKSFGCFLAFTRSPVASIGGGMISRVMSRFDRKLQLVLLAALFLAGAAVSPSGAQSAQAGTSVPVKASIPTHYKPNHAPKKAE